MQRMIVLGDLHLVRDTPPEVTRDLLSVIDEHRGARIVVAGDLFDLSADFPRTSRDVALREALDRQPEVRRAFAEHIERDGEVWLIAGNHDAAIGDPEHHSVIADALELHGAARSRLRTTPWFLREAGLHLEHGHFYDPDNAPSHPLNARERCLGVHFVEDFIAPTGAYRYLNSNDDTPLKLFTRAFTWYGFRAPYVIYRYFHTAILAMLSSGPFFDATKEVERGKDLEALFAETIRLSPELVRELVGLGVAPTMTSLPATFKRVYFDRVLATLSLMAGIGALSRKRYGIASWALGVGALSMATSWALGHDRYGGTVPEMLERSAGEIVRVSEARLVVMGHAHREALTDTYANTGSFSFPRDAPGRPFLEIEGTPENPRASRRYFKSEG